MNTLNTEALKQRFNSDSIRVRWESLASSLARLSNIAKTGDISSELFQAVLMETKLFSDWIAHEFDDEELETLLMLLSLQRALAKWTFPQRNTDSKQIEKEAREWSKKILNLSGLLSK